MISFMINIKYIQALSNTIFTIEVKYLNLY